MGPRIRKLCRVLGLLLLLQIQHAAGADSATETAVKIGFIFNFLKFIEWPAEVASREPLVLCTSGTGAVGEGLSLLEGKKINDKILTVRQQVPGDALRACHMVYLADRQRHEAVLSGLRGYPVVTVADDDDFIRKGGMIGLVSVGERLGFEVNLAPAQASRVRISATLLKLAKTVQGGK